MRAWIGPLAIVAVSAALWSVRGRSAAPPAPLPVLGAVPAFALVDQGGQPFTRASVNGQVWVAQFMFTRCAGQCPLMAQRTQALLRELDGLPVRVVSFSVDPAHDTPETLAAYARRYGARPGTWDFVTGAPGAVQALAEQGFRLAVDEGGPPEEPITHSVRLALVDREGRVRGAYDATAPEALGWLRADARRLAVQP